MAYKKSPLQKLIIAKGSGFSISSTKLSSPNLIQMIILSWMNSSNSFRFTSFCVSTNRTNGQLKNNFEDRICLQKIGPHKHSTRKLQYNTRMLLTSLPVISDAFYCTRGLRKIIILSNASFATSFTRSEATKQCCI